MKTVRIEIPKYSKENGFLFAWEDDFVIKIDVQNDVIHLQANEPGLRSLAKILLTLSQPTIMKNYHLHLDDSNSLEDGSTEIIIEKV